MAVLYKTIQSTKENKDGMKLFHPRAVHIATIDSAQMAKEIAEYSSLSTGDVKNTIDNMVTVMTKHLQASESVTVDGLGTFSLIMRSRGKGAATAKEVSAAQSTLLVRFTPASTRNQDRTVATRALITGVKCVPYQKEENAPGEGGNGPGGNGGEEETDPLG
ncbi:HU family DNA-binding protein [uncultured Bacteroides sp.]|uniref:HU family DNA-binding protein n=1 Tax=uncultured Bacteroides sp. TaxID=162156 RepID=UPI0025DCC561|nr:HU family DNA-binding protein [uncultured Bacteroides sp.]